MIHISTLSDLQAIKNNLTGQYILDNDINAADTVTWNGGLGFEPIGTSTSAFKGSLDGNGHTISNLYINRPSTSYDGLFGYIKNTSTPPYDAVIGVTLSSASITGGNSTGGITGYVGTYDNVSGSVSGSVTGLTSVGGIAAVVLGGVSNSINSATIVGSGSNIGGIVGGNSGAVSNSISTGSVTGTAYVGGVVGANTKTIRRCISTGNISGVTDVGGLCGYLSSRGSIAQSYATGTAYASSNNAGGFVGRMAAAGPNVIIDSYSIGVPSSPGVKGGFAGEVYSSNYIEYSNWDTQTSSMANGTGNGTLAGGIDFHGMTTSEFGSQSNFATNTQVTEPSGYTSLIAWDTTVWIFCTRPLLIWHDPVCPYAPPPYPFWTRLVGTTQT